jgi:nucleoside-diphosphate-sugar epimerase
LFASTIYVNSDSGAFYRSSKQSSELIIEDYKKIYGIDYTIMRYGLFTDLEATVITGYTGSETGPDRRADHKRRRRPGDTRIYTRPGCRKDKRGYAL